MNDLELPPCTEPLAAVLHRPHIRPYLQKIMSALNELLTMDIAAQQVRLKALGLAKLGWRQEVVNAIEALWVPGNASTGGDLPRPALSPTLYAPPPPIHHVLAAETDVEATAAAAALALAEQGFALCTGGLPELARTAAAAAADLYANGLMRCGRTPDGSYAIPKEYTGGVPVSSWIRRASGRVHDGSHGGHNCQRDHGILEALDSHLQAFAHRVVGQLSGLHVVSSRGDLFPFGRSGGADDDDDSGVGRVLHITETAELMVSCFPGDGTSYAPHVDNADGDSRKQDLGRCLVRALPQTLPLVLPLMALCFPQSWCVIRSSRARVLADSHLLLERRLERRRGWWCLSGVLARASG